MARHSERSLPSLARARAGQPTVSTPRPTCSRVTTTDGRSPGLRIAILRRLPRTRVPSGFVTKNSPLTVAGAAAGSSSDHSHHIPILIPRGEPSPSPYWLGIRRVNWVHGVAWIQDLLSVVGVTQALECGPARPACSAEIQRRAEWYRLVGSNHRPLDPQSSALTS